MTNESFEALVRRLEEQAQRNPGAYRVRVGLLAALGYGYLLLLILGTGLLIALLIGLVVLSGRLGFVVIKFVIVLGAFAVAVLRSLWIRFPEPDGIPLSRAEAAPLFAAVDRLTEKLGAPRFHHILLTNDLNAAVTQRPRLGVFGWHQNYLLLGLPLLLTLTPVQVEAIIAHELGHLRGGHSRFTCWIYRVHVGWAQVLERTHGSGANALVSWFFNWYAPLFAAYSFPLRRQNEYEADRVAAETVGRENTVSALCVLDVWEEYLGRTFWKPYYKQVHSQSKPPEAPFTRLLTHPLAPALSGEGRADADLALMDALRAETTFADLHPSLTDRLAALKVEGALPDAAPAPEQTAATRFLGPLLRNLAARLDGDFLRKITQVWIRMYQEAQAERQRLEALTARVANGGRLGAEEAFEYAHLTEEYVSPEAAFPLYKELTVREDAARVKGGALRAVALLEVGRLLVKQRDPAAVSYLEQAVQTHQQIAIPALSMLYAYYRRTGDNITARETYVRALRAGDAQESGKQERWAAVAASGGARYANHNLTAEQIGLITEALKELPEAEEVYLVRQEGTHYAEKPVLVIAFTLRNERQRANPSGDAQYVTRAIKTALQPLLADPRMGFAKDVDWKFLALYGPQRTTVKALLAVPGSLLLRL